MTAASLNVRAGIMTVIDEIIAKRKEEIACGTDTGSFVPPVAREVPVSDFGCSPFVIAEVKKKSPSKGIFIDNFNHMEAASSYIERGIKNISVITEKNYFAGSLSFLYEIKKRYPEAAVLRKDFLVCENDIEVSYNCGADALLLIASALDKEMFERLYRLTVSKGMKALVEIHDEDDLEKVRSLKPPLMGINSRDLRDFSVDMISPLMLKDKIDWECSVVYESGIGSLSDAVYAFSAGFKGILTGESVIKNRSLASVYIDAFYAVQGTVKDTENYFWKKLYSRKTDRPLVKICGITNAEDCRAASDAGADVIGMVFAKSVRAADISLPYRLKGLDILKTAVLVNPDDSMISLMRKYISEGLLDAVQLSGDESPDFCSSLDIPFYKTLRIRDEKDYEKSKNYRSVRILTDSFVKGSYGGTGEKLSDEILEKIRVKAGGKLWLAGGVSAANAEEIIDRYSPELLDASSSLESAPGKKDHEKMRLFIGKVKGNIS